MRVECVVVDTNDLISALLSPDSTRRRVLNRLAQDNATLLFSDVTFAELASRLAKHLYKLDVELAKSGVGGCQRQRFERRLRRQHTVEGVSMRYFPGARLERVRGGYGQPFSL